MMKHVYPRFLLVLFVALGLSLSAWGQDPDDEMTFRVLEIEKTDPAEMITAMHADQNLSRVLVGIPSANMGASGKAVIFEKNRGSIIEPYARFEIAPPTNAEASSLVWNGSWPAAPGDPEVLLPSFGEDVAIDFKGDLIAISAPGNPASAVNPSGFVFIYTVLGTGNAAPELFAIIKGPSTNDTQTAFPPDLPTGFEGNTYNFGRSLALKADGKILTISGIIDVVSNPDNPTQDNVGISSIFKVVNAPGKPLNLRVQYVSSATQEGFDNRALLSDDDFGAKVQMAETTFRPDLPMGAPTMGQSRRGVPGGFLEEIDGGAILLGIFQDFDNPESLIPLNDLTFFYPPDPYNAPGNGFGTDFRISDAGEDLIAVSSDGSEGALWFFNTTQLQAGPPNYVPFVSKLVSGDAPSGTYGSSLSISAEGQWSLVGDNAGAGKVYLHDLDMITIDPGVVQGGDVAPEDMVEPTFAISPATMLERVTAEINANPQDQMLRIFWQNVGDTDIDITTESQAFIDLITNLSGFGSHAEVNNADITNSRQNLRFAVTGESMYDFNGAQDNHFIGVFDIAAAPLLPVELISFAATPETGGIRLAWETATETENAGFAVQRSHNARDWEELGWMDGYGTTTSPKSYQFLDENPYNGVNYYRLEQRDFNGATTLTDVVSAKIEVSMEVMNVYPNPVRDVLNVVTPPNMPVTLVVYNSNGQLLLQQEYLDGNKELLLSRLSAGTYVLEVRNGNEVIHTQKILKY